MIEDDFYATVKLKSGEEIFAKVAASDEDDRTLLLVTNPVVVSEVKTKTGSPVGYWGTSLCFFFRYNNRICYQE